MSLRSRDWLCGARQEEKEIDTIGDRSAGSEYEVLARALPSIERVKNWESEDGSVLPMKAMEVPEVFLHHSKKKRRQKM